MNLKKALFFATKLSALSIGLYLIFGLAGTMFDMLLGYILHGGVLPASMIIAGTYFFAILFSRKSEEEFQRLMRVAVLYLGFINILIQIIVIAANWYLIEFSVRVHSGYLAVAAMYLATTYFIALILKSSLKNKSEAK